jgi:spore coat polysaccharide biosynthesis protein SpsF (cytidylyltransferase family)
MSQNIDDLIVAIPDTEQNNKLENFLTALGIHVSRGQESSTSKSTGSPVSAVL